jgi:hypothetical protein
MIKRERNEDEEWKGSTIVKKVPERGREKINLKKEIYKKK